MNRFCLYYVHEPKPDRFILGDHYIRPIIRRIIRGKSLPGGVDKVFINLCLGLDKLGIQYEVNLPFNQLRQGDRIGVLGRGHHCLKGYNLDFPIVAGIGLMTHPSEWPSLCEDYPVVKYLQHSDWANEVYKPYFGDRCDIWPVGIDTDSWSCSSHTENAVDFLIYDKVRWDYQQREADLLVPLRKQLNKLGLSFEELRYGKYKPEEYQEALNRCNAMIFLCEHESQGIAYQECLSTNTPILAWDQGFCLDPNRFAWSMPEIPATSVPFWDARCGIKFQNIQEFSTKLDEFLDRLHQQQFSPRNYILENLTLEQCAQRYSEILEAVQVDRA